MIGARRAYDAAVPRPTRPAPRTHSPAWPDAPCGDPVAETVRLLSVRLRAAIGGRALRAVGASTGVDHTVVLDILNGNAWPDVATLARLEHGLGVDLWPGRRD